MAVIAFMHAHPDDEAIATSGTMALMAAAGHEVILITATDGAVGEVEDGVLADGETLAEVRQREVMAAAGVIGVSQVVMLGYGDSGMMGTEPNHDPDCFWQADVETAALDLAARLTDLAVDVLTVYDEIGGYGHPDHIQVHRVGHRAAEIAGTAHVYESTINRDQVAAADLPEIDEVPPDLGTPAAEITTAIDVSSVIDLKRKAMQAHPSQIAEDSWILTMEPELFDHLFGTEWFVQKTPPVQPGAERTGSLL